VERHPKLNYIYHLDWKALQPFDPYFICRRLSAIDLKEGSDLPSVEEVFKIFQGSRLAFARAFEKMISSEHKTGQCIPESNMEIVVEGGDSDWMKVTLGVERLGASQILLPEGNMACARAIVSKVYTDHINGEGECVNDPGPTEHRLVFVE
jgi:hypothetical protein